MPKLSYRRVFTADFLPSLKSANRYKPSPSQKLIQKSFYYILTATWSHKRSPVKIPIIVDILFFISLVSSHGLFCPLSATLYWWYWNNFRLPFVTELGPAKLFVGNPRTRSAWCLKIWVPYCQRGRVSWLQQDFESHIRTIYGVLVPIMPIKMESSIHSSGDDSHSCSYYKMVQLEPIRQTQLLYILSDIPKCWMLPGRFLHQQRAAHTIIFMGPSSNLPVGGVGASQRYLSCTW